MSSTPITVLHLADLHFGVDNYGYTNPVTGMNTRLEDFSKSLGKAVEYAKEESVDLVVFSGDAYKRNQPSPTEQRELVKHFLDLADAGIPVVMISGNHDIPVMAGRASSIDIFRRLRPGQFHVFVNQPTLGGSYPEPPVIETKNGPVAVCCLPYISPSFLRSNPQYQKMQGDEFKVEFENFMNHIVEVMAKNIPEEIPRILSAHFTVHGCVLGGYRGLSLYTDEIQVLPSTLANSGYDYVALGHIHRHQNLSPRREIPVVYPGSIDRVDFGEAEEEKGFVVAKVSRGYAEFEYVPIKVRRFVDIRVEDEDPEVELTERILNAIARESIGGSVVRVSYAAKDEEMPSLDLRKVHEALKTAHYKVGLIRIPKEREARRRATTLSSDILLTDALTAYIQENEDLKPDTPVILEKAKEIDQAVRGG